MPTTTPAQSLPVMTDTDDPNVPEDILNLALAIEKRLMGVYNTYADRDARIPAPVEGQVAFTKDNNIFTYYDGAAWQYMFPTQVSITSGTTAPSGGSNGDVYFRV